MKWHVRLAGQAEQDFASIVGWTQKQFGAQQAATYEHTLRLAIRALGAGPLLRGIRWRDDLGAGIGVLRVARDRRRGRHLVVFKLNSGEQKIVVLRVLHESMDIERHLIDSTEPPLIH